MNSVLAIFRYCPCSFAETQRTGKDLTHAAEDIPVGVILEGDGCERKLEHNQHLGPCVGQTA
jgi:hypothetical protein